MHRSEREFSKAVLVRGYRSLQVAAPQQLATVTWGSWTSTTSYLEKPPLNYKLPGQPLTALKGLPAAGAGSRAPPRGAPEKCDILGCLWTIFLMKTWPFNMLQYMQIKVHRCKTAKNNVFYDMKNGAFMCGVCHAHFNWSSSRSWKEKKISTQILLLSYVCVYGKHVMLSNKHMHNVVH